ncbi:MAG: tRNA lysidine(34) synthetase TilS [Gammaproteobacteria bacterium]|nr:tRNA lysidine(34) synthetase TilS [Gammaproteobacteria bacterium]
MNTPIAEHAQDRTSAAALVARCHGRLAALLGGDGNGVERLLVAYSGGLDSTVLLHIVREFCRRRALTLEAHHVDHALQAGSAAWSRHCQATANRWGVAFTSTRLRGSPPPGASVEDWARQQRYASLLARCDSRTALLTAHHRDDQAETVLLHALRASGPHGLAGIRAHGHHGDTPLWRPLLEESRAQLQSYARGHGLEWLDDPSNEVLGFARNRMRHTVLPVLEREFPGAALALAEVARLQSEVVEVLDGVADQLLGDVERLPLALLRGSAVALRPYLIKRWLKRRGAPAPGRTALQHMLGEMLGARSDGQPQTAWQGVAVRRYDDCYFLTAAHLSVPPAAPQAWPAPWTSLALAQGELRAINSSGSDAASAALLAAAPLNVRYRAGGERLRLHARGPRRELKHLFQEWRVPPWQRMRWPLLYVGEQLAVVPGLGVAAEFRVRDDEPGLQILWVGANSFAH